MNKDVIYIDVEDDITAIIGKVKAASSKIVALVPPKRIGVLQSAVNLRLLNRAATQGGKHLVLISGNGALTALAAAAKIPVAKNLQSKPEIVVSAPAVDDDESEDLIDGSKLPVGDHARMADAGAASLVATSPAVDEAVRENAAEESVKLPLGRKAVKASGVKVPNFDKFRKKMVFIIGGGALLVAFLVWAVFFAAHATVIISARTTSSAVNAQVTFDPALATSLQNGTLKSVTKQVKKDQVVDFTATGQKNVGNKATGTVKFSTNSIASLGTTIPAGTVLTASNGKTYTTDQSVTITINNYQGAPSGITASAQGTASNGASGAVSGAPSGISATIPAATSGGTDQTITTVTQSDISQAAAQLQQQNTDDMKKQLAAQFDTNYIIVDQSFKTDQSQPTSAPALDQEATDGKAKLTSSTTFSLSAVAKSDVKQFLDDYFAAKINGKTNQRIYDDGATGATFANTTPGDKGVFTANLVTNGKIGPKIDDQAVKDAAAGKRYGEIQQSLQEIQGVDTVDVKFSPFWVSTAPTDTKRIGVEFKLDASK